MPAILNRIRHGERVDHYETRRRRKDGTIIDISLTVSPIRAEDGTIVGASKIARDISERKRAEKILVEQSERLAQSNADLQEFAYIISHDLQEPLRTVASLSELLKRRYKSKLDNGADQLIQMIVGSAMRMSELIRDVLSYSRAMSDGAPPSNKFDANKVVGWVTDNLKTAIEESNASLEIAPLPVVTGDKATLTQVLQNLIANSIKYRGEQPPCIRIGAETTETEWIFSVSDNGIGIPADYHGTIFGLFKRLHGNEYAGTGIGLAVCKRLIQKQGGRIWVDSQPGQGATFFFTIPRKRKHAS
jgi:light-regulated signal transduction histidine kinase (bacteriophytochrome)